MTGLKDFSALEFIVWPPSSPWERESEWGDLIVPVSFGWTESCRFFTSTFFAIVITSLWNYSYSLFIHMQRFFNPLPPSPPCERQFVCLPYQHLLSQVQIQKLIHKLQIQILNRTTRIILMSSWKSFQICRPPLSSPLIANCQKSRSGTQIIESPNQSWKEIQKFPLHFENCSTAQLKKKCFLLIVTQLFRILQTHILLELL